MSPIRFVRTQLLGISQVELARIAETTQATVSRWESGHLEPGLSELARIRAACLARGIAWREEYFFDAGGVS